MEKFKSIDEAREEYPRCMFLILTDDEANERAKEEIENLLWAFNPNFLAYETGLDECVFKGLQGKCESSNDAIRSLVEKTCGIDNLIEAAIDADGRGHFISSYDGDELEIDINGEDYFVYRIN